MSNLYINFNHNFFLHQSIHIFLPADRGTVTYFSIALASLASFLNIYAPHKHTRFYCSCFKLLVCSRCRTCNTYFFLSLCLSVAYNSYPKSQWGCFFCVQDILSLSLLLQNTVFLCTKPSL